MIMNTPRQNVNADEELVFAMMTTSGFEVAGRSIALIVAMRVYRTAPRHPVGSTPSAESVEVRLE